MSRAGLVSLIAMMQGCFSPEGGDDDVVGCIEDAACKADRVCRDRQCVAADDDDDDSEAPDEVPPPDACEWNSDCASGCCKPALLDGDAAGWGECRPTDECVATSCEPVVCDIDWCDVGVGCLVSWYDDGACDCGCQFADVDCE